MSEVKVHLAIDLADGEHVVLQPDYESLKFDFDAQRLRANTAEAELARTHATFVNAVKVENEKWSMKLAAAEQRIAVLIKALKEIRENSDDIGACECAADALKDAALNQKSEGESQ